MPRPDIVLLDLNLPRKNGHGILAEIRRDPSLRLIPAVVLTTSSSPDDIQRSYDLQANCFITNRPTSSASSARSKPSASTGSGWPACPTAAMAALPDLLPR